MGKRENAQDRRARRTAKKEKKTKEKDKEKLKGATAAAKSPEQSIEEILKEIERESRPAAPTETVCRQPSPRAFASLTAHPDKEQLLLFGGEFNTGRKTLMYNDLYIFNTKRNEWKLCKYPAAPPPRSSHQAVALSREGGQLWLFGGEFVSPNGSQFYHYKDMWVLHMTSKTWEKVESKKGTSPTPRSGHRMVVYDRKIVLFGGCFDNMQKNPRYYNDVYVFDVDERIWTKLQLPVTQLQPDPRSGCQLAAGPNGILLYGGYTSVHVKGEIFRGQVHTDMWLLKCTEAAAGADASEGKLVKWEWTKIKSGAGMPSARASASMAARGSMAYSFGGVCDEETEDAIKGQFFNDLFAMNLETYKWYAVEPKLPICRESLPDKMQAMASLPDVKAAGKGKNVKKQTMVVAATVEPSEIAPAPGEQESEASESSSLCSADEDEDAHEAGDRAAAAAAEAAEPAEVVFPLPRINPALAVKGTRLYLYGGGYEIGDREVTLSDLYYIDVGKSERWYQLHENDSRTQEMLDELSSSDSSDSEEEEEKPTPKPGTKKYQQLKEQKEKK